MESDDWVFTECLFTVDVVIQGYVLMHESDNILCVCVFLWTHIHPCVCVCVSQEHELDSAVRNSSVDSMRVELEELQREKVELDRKQRQLDLEMSSLNTHTTARTQMDMLKKDKVGPAHTQFYNL